MPPSPQPCYWLMLVWQYLKLWKRLQINVQDSIPVSKSIGLIQVYFFNHSVTQNVGKCSDLGCSNPLGSNFELVLLNGCGLRPKVHSFLCYLLPPFIYTIISRPTQATACNPTFLNCFLIRAYPIRLIFFLALSCMCTPAAWCYSSASDAVLCSNPPVSQSQWLSSCCCG